MDEGTVTLGTSFVAGLLSFLSPCVLPIVPGYITWLSGRSIDELADATDRRAAMRDVGVHALLFVLGFSVVFIALGAGATLIGSWLRGHLPLMIKIGGGLVIVLGLHMARLLPIPWLYREKRLHLVRKPAGRLGSFAVGLAFAFGWTPCLGPILAGILTLAGTRETLQEGVLMLTAYSLGLGVPFVLTGLAIGSFFGLYRRISPWIPWFERISGLLLVGIGYLLLTDQLGWLAARLGFLQIFAL